MRHIWWRTVALCAVLALMTDCAAEHGVTSSGSDQWSRGVILDTTPAEVVAVAARGEETVVVWPDESGQLRLALLDAALTVTDITDLALQAFYPNDMRLQVDASGGLHLTWEDRLAGVPALMYARLAPGVAEPTAQAEIRLLRAGKPVAEADGRELRFSATEPGAYRVEVYRSGRPWIFSNPIYIRETRAAEEAT